MFALIKSNTNRLFSASYEHGNHPAQALDLKLFTERLPKAPISSHALGALDIDATTS